LVSAIFTGISGAGRRKQLAQLNYTINTRFVSGLGEKSEKNAQEAFREQESAHYLGEASF
jgi:hypothetical protein